MPRRYLARPGYRTVYGQWRHDRGRRCVEHATPPKSPALADCGCGTGFGPMTVQTRKVTIKHGKTSRNFVVREVADWQGVAQYLADLLKPGSVVSLSGPLGAGKTTLVQYLAKTLGAPKCALSPTFALMRIYKIEYRMSNIECRRGKKQEECIRKERHSIFDIRYSSYGSRRRYRIEDERGPGCAGSGRGATRAGHGRAGRVAGEHQGVDEGQDTIQVNIITNTSLAHWMGEGLRGRVSDRFLGFSCASASFFASSSVAFFCFSSSSSVVSVKSDSMPPRAGLRPR